MNQAPIVRDVVLVGGGHSHVLLIRSWAMQPIPGVRLTLVSSSNQTPYSGMLPGLIAGHYQLDEIHVDLLRLCAWANVRFIEHSVTGLDLESKCIQFEKRPAIEFDILSLDTGSTPDLSVPGSSAHVTPVKPVSNFHARWESLRERVASNASESLSIAVVGSGAGGFELVTAMRHALPDHKAEVYWILRGDHPLGGRPYRVGQLALEAAQRADIRIVRRCDITRVEPNRLIAADGRTFELDEILWCTSAIAPEWPQLAGLTVDQRGFVATNSKLQSVSHEFVFATGDIGTQIKTPSDKAGVFAVRQAPVLFKNIRALLLRETLIPYVPQNDFLSLMATGPKHAIASRGFIAIEGKWVWRWKDWIDQRFMARFRQLPVMRMNNRLAVLPNALLSVSKPGLDSVSSHDVNPQTRCRGCGAKLGEDTLLSVLSGFAGNEHLVQSRVSTSVRSAAQDAAVLDCLNQRIVQSVDQINAIVDDPYLLGQIAAVHALSDVLTLNAKLHSAQVLISLPESSESIAKRELSLLMQGVHDALNAEDCAVIGGHTSQGHDFSVGLVVNATLGDTLDSEVCTGDSIVLTQGLGVGVLFAGLMQQQVKGEWIASAIRAMLVSNRKAADTLRSNGATAMTDVTGFGMLGHLHRLMSSFSFGATLFARQVPLLPGALEASEAGIRSSLWPQNKLALDRVTLDCEISSHLLALLCDPQTSGGLLAIVPAQYNRACIEQLRVAGYPQACVVGTLEQEPGVRICD